MNIDINFTWKKYCELTLDELYEILKVRQEIFVLEQHCSYLDLDEKDKHSLHLRGCTNRSLVAYLRVIIATDVIKIGRVLTVPSMRKKGLAKQMMSNTLKKINELYHDLPIELAAQVHLQKFYESFGFHILGAPYEDAGILHIDMRKIS